MKRPQKTRLKAAVFAPRPMGVFILLIIVLAFAAGALRHELALILSGAVFSALWVYCLAMTLLLALLHKRRIRRIVIRISPQELSAGEMAEAVYAEGDGFKGKIFQLPGVLVRCRLLLATKDGRHIQHDFNPAVSSAHFFEAQKRGAYFSMFDEFAVFDILGFFRFAYRIFIASASTEAADSADSPRLLVSPHAADEPPPVNARAGESLLKPEPTFQRTDNLIDHRPYVPGDDPRRINWKLYSHSGGLFVREGEYEPPPHSNIIILIDTEYDPALYSEREALPGIDLLCENGLAAALACAESGMEVLTGYSGNGIRMGNAPSAFAWPAASPLSQNLNLPAAPDTHGIIILALPRSTSENSAIDRFLNDGAYQNKTVELLFFCGGINTVAYQERLAAAEICASLYNRRAGVRARVFGV
ncbi:MAG: DUF58 domain-containing protein [Treponema sp.]|jgi:hypothetical protein|nr:DUF58 domain-containing protein [Treponema sp.]